MSPVSKSIFKKFLAAIPFGEVARKAPTTDRGQRLWPPQTSQNDKKYNLRVDKGSSLPDGREQLIIQANKNAEDQSARKSAQKDSHKIVAMVAIDPQQDLLDEEAINEEAMASFYEQNYGD